MSAEDKSLKYFKTTLLGLFDEYRTLSTILGFLLFFIFKPISILKE